MQQLIAEALANQAAAAAAANPPAAHPQFALSPAKATHGVLDYATSEGSKIFRAATAPLPYLFDCTAGNTMLFLQVVSERAALMDWDAQLLVEDDDGTPRSLLTEYGMLSIENVRAKATTYVGTQTRDAQNAAQIHQCIMASLTNEGRTRLLTKAALINVNGVPDGLALLKVILTISYVDTRSTVSHIRRNLASLDTAMKVLKYDIVAFNEYVDTQVMSLSARGETTTDLLEFLLLGYEATKDEQFKAYINRKRDSYEETGDLTPTALMAHAADKYRALSRDKKWNAPSAKDLEIIAMAAEVKQLRADSANWTAQKSEHQRAPTATRGPSNTASDKRERSLREGEQWKLIPPGASDPTTMNRPGSDKPWHWCPHHHQKGMWVRHLPSECNNRPKISFSQSMATVIEEEGDDNPFNAFGDTHAVL